MGASHEEEQPVLPRDRGGASHANEECSCCLCVTGLIAAGILVISAAVWHADQSNMPPEYSVAITAVSGLQPAATADPQPQINSRGGVLYPVFNLTVGLASHSVLAGGCIEPGTAVRVSYSYLRLPMASGRAPDMCVAPREAAERQVVARGREVAMPGFLVGSLAEEMRRGEAAFEVKLTSLEEDGKSWKVVTCWARAGSAGAGASKPCVQSFTMIDEMPEPQPGDSGYVQHPVSAAEPLPP